MDKTNNTTNVSKTEVNDSVIIRSKVGSFNDVTNVESENMSNSNPTSHKSLNFANLYKYLIDFAEAKKKVTYKGALTDFKEDFSSKRHYLNSLLDEISEHNKNNKEPLLAALVVNQDTDIPGDGFFKKWLNREDYSEEIELIFNYKWKLPNISDVKKGVKTRKICNPDCPCWGHSTTGPKKCPICGFEFKKEEKGWSGIDAHYNKNHKKDLGMNYQEWKSLICDEHRPGK